MCCSKDHCHAGGKTVIYLLKGHTVLLLVKLDVKLAFGIFLQHAVVMQKLTVSLRLTGKHLILHPVSVITLLGHKIGKPASHLLACTQSIHMLDKADGPYLHNMRYELIAHSEAVLQF